MIFYSLINSMFMSRTYSYGSFKLLFNINTKTTAAIIAAIVWLPIALINTNTSIATTSSYMNIIKLIKPPYVIQHAVVTHVSYWSLVDNQCLS